MYETSLRVLRRHPEIDNMKTVVQKRLLKEIVLTSVFADFTHYYGFQVDV